MINHSDNRLPKILLICRKAPGQIDIGPLFLRDLCRFYPRDRICCVHFQRQTELEQDPSLAEMRMVCLGAPRETGRSDWARPAKRHRLLRKLHTLDRHVFERYVESVQIPRLVRQIVEIGREEEVDLVWAAFCQPNTIRVAKPVAEALGKDLILTVWDPPGGFMDSLGTDTRTQRRVVSNFEQSIRHAVRCGVASDEMGDQYQERYGTPCVPMTRGVQRPASLSAIVPRDSDDIRIGFAGNLYPEKEWNVLLSALASRNWRLGERNVRIQMLTSRIEFNEQQTARSLRIEYLGWRSTDEAITLLSQMDAAYLPYWIDEKHKETVKVTFPSKLATYVAARVPVLYHGPLDSTPTRFLNRYPVGVSCHTLLPDDVIAALEGLINDPEFSTRARQACDDAYDAEFTQEVFRHRFADLVGVAAEELLPA